MGRRVELAAFPPQTIPGAARQVCGAAVRRSERRPAPSTVQGPARRTSYPKSRGSPALTPSGTRGAS